MSKHLDSTSSNIFTLTPNSTRWPRNPVRRRSSSPRWRQTLRPRARMHIITRGSRTRAIVRISLFDLVTFAQESCSHLLLPLFVCHSFTYRRPGRATNQGRRRGDHCRQTRHPSVHLFIRRFDYICTPHSFHPPALVFLCVLTCRHANPHHFSCSAQTEATRCRSMFLWSTSSRSTRRKSR